MIPSCFKLPPMGRQICGPVQVQIQGFQPVSDDVAFIDMEALGRAEPLLGYVTLEKSRAVVDMVGHRVVQGPPFDLKRAGRPRGNVCFSRPSRQDPA
jgi:hypothetical protein